MGHWCEEHGVARGAVVTLAQCWELSKKWYVDRLNPEWRPKTIEEMESIFSSVGLEGPFWDVRGEQG